MIKLNNIIKSEIVKLKKSPSIRFLLLLELCLAVFFIVSIILSNNTMASDIKECLTLGFVSSTSVLQLYIITFIIIFISLDFTTKSVRNYISIGVRRRDFCMAKFIVSMLVGLLITLLHPLVMIIVSIIFNNKLEINFTLDVLGNIIMQIILYSFIYMSLVSLFVMISFIGKTITNTIGISFAYMIIILMSYNCFGQTVLKNIFKYITIGQLGIVAQGISLNEGLNMIFACIIKIILIIFISIKLFNKSEI